MPRQSRIDIVGEVYHVINRANARSLIFETDDDFAAVFNALEETLGKIPLDIFSFCIMSNHWHFAVRPKRDGDMGRFFGKMTQTITQRWHAFHHTTGSGHLFQGRFKTFLVQTDAHFVQLMKYIEANPLRANLVNRAEDWKWGSLYARTEKTNCASKILKAWPVDMPSDYIDEANRPLPKMIIEQIRESVVRGRPLGDEIWVNGAIGRYKLEYTIRQRGGQRKFD